MEIRVALSLIRHAGETIPGMWRTIRWTSNQSNGDESDLDTANMTGQDMAMRLLELITENRGDEEQMRKILDYAVKVFSEPRKPSS